MVRVRACDVEDGACPTPICADDADFRVALVFKGDVKVSPSTTAENPLIVSGLAAPSAVTISITMVPDGMFEGKVCRATGAILAPFRAIRRNSILTRHPPPQTADDFLDPADERVWVLIHDAGTADAQYFAVALNGTRAVVCFRDESSAESCRSALDGNGQRQPSVASVMLDEVLYELDDDEDTELCLVDEVVERRVERLGQVVVPAARRRPAAQLDRLEVAEVDAAGRRRALAPQRTAGVHRATEEATKGSRSSRRRA